MASTRGVQGSVDLPKQFVEEGASLVARRVSEGRNATETSFAFGSEFLADASGYLFSRLLTLSNTVKLITFRKRPEQTKSPSLREQPDVGDRNILIAWPQVLLIKQLTPRRFSLKFLQATMGTVE